MWNNFILDFYINIKFLFYLLILSIFLIKFSLFFTSIQNNNKKVVLNAIFY